MQPEDGRPERHIVRSWRIPLLMAPPRDGLSFGQYRASGVESAAMPLLAFSASGVRFPSWSMTNAEWDALKAEYRELRLTASCCSNAVVPVVSSRGWRFYRHAPGIVCDHRESPEHIVAKTLAARAADDLGLDVTTEACGPDGCWRADVLIRHPARGWSVALEIQMSRCPLDEIERRQAAYAADAVRGAWLVGFRLPDYEPNRDLPLFRLVPLRNGILDPWVDRGDGEPTSISDFVTLLLTRRVVLREPPSHTLSLSVVGSPSTCWRCFQHQILLVSFVNAPAGVLAPKGWLLAKDLAKVSKIHTAYRQAVPMLLRTVPELTVLRPPRRMEAQPDLQAYCPTCDAPQSLYRLSQDLLDPLRQRCWTLQEGREWSLRERVRPRWDWPNGPVMDWP
ncbi:competence protein CoiA family protein [Azospirillum argentinense]|uniref:competence protein CoiA family protein n=1 Tax=Azospirillum argentinense TaxID=2970906 RepID=UPI00158F45C8|nr:competence protein CoiA family protein [Azospirillum argentinense]